MDSLSPRADHPPRSLPLSRCAEFMAESGDVARCLTGNFTPTTVRRALQEIAEARVALDELEGSIRKSAAFLGYEIA